MNGSTRSSFESDRLSSQSKLLTTASVNASNTPASAENQEVTSAISDQRPCGLKSLLPTFGMSCRGRAEAFARRLHSRLRTLGSQNVESPTSDEDPIQQLNTENTWLTEDAHGQVVTSLQPLSHLSHEADAFFDFDCEPESPGSPVDECEYSRLIETASVTPQNAPESGFICASPASPDNASQASQSSSEGQYFDPESSEAEQRSLTNEFYDCLDVSKNRAANQVKASPISARVNGNHYTPQTDDVLTANNNDSSESESLPPSQDTSTSASTNCTTPGSQSNQTFTCVTSDSNSTLQDVVLNELRQQSDDVTKLSNGNHYTELFDDNVVEECKELLTENSDFSNGFLENNFEHATDLCPESSIVIQEASSSELGKRSDNENQTETNVHETEKNKIDENDAKEGSESSSINRQHLSATCDTDDDDDCRPQRVRRCSSLKTGKTPPGTPGRKKIVRFADVLGLDLADVKTFLDEIPTVPQQAYEDLEFAMEQAAEAAISLGPQVDKILMPLFQQPGGLATFLDIVRQKQVSLENAAVTDPINLTITGSVRVRNLDFHKSVHIRYTLDNWRSYADMQATYVQNSCDGFSDKFSFILFGNSMHVGQRMEFSVRFQCKGQQFWDNNYGVNYCFQCLPASQSAAIHTRPIIPHHHASSILSPSDAWSGSGSFY